MTEPPRIRYSIYIQRTISHRFEIEAESLQAAIEAARFEIEKHYSIDDEIILNGEELSHEPIDIAS